MVETIIDTSHGSLDRFQTVLISSHRLYLSDVFRKRTDDIIDNGFGKDDYRSSHTILSVIITSHVLNLFIHSIRVAIATMTGKALAYP